MPRPTPPSATLDASSLDEALAAFQARLNQLEASLAQQNKLATMGMVMAVIAHEFNNILTPMINYTKIALTDEKDQALRTKALSKALAGAERLEAISKSLLGFARGDESTTANVAAAVKETLSCLARDLSKDGITLTLDIPPDLVVAMNAGRLQQVLMNLIVNARSAMVHRPPPQLSPPVSPPLSSPRPASGIKRLTILATVNRQSNIATLALADTGPGIPAEILPRIFEPFFSTKSPSPASPDSSTAPKTSNPPPPAPGGTGLGLTICRELITAAHGSIRATSQPGKGATFILELPLA